MRKKSRFSKNDASLLLLALIALFLAVGAVAAVYTLRGNPVEEALSSDRVINALFVIEQEQKPLCAYVLMYYPATRRAAIFDVPGEVGHLIKRIDRIDRIDAVYNPGRITEFENEIEDLLGIGINFSMVITTENLGRMVDMIEGVELFIRRAVQILGDDETVLFPSGETRLDGDKAILYLSHKTPEEDREMVASRRQRFFLSFLKRQGEMNKLLKNQAVSKMYYSFLRTNMSQRTMFRLFDEFARIDTYRISFQSVGGNWREISGQMLLIPAFNGTLIQDVVRQTMGTLTRQSDGSMNERVFTVEVLNGTTVGGLAGRTAELFRSYGYDIILVDNADRQDYEKTGIIDRSGNEDEAKRFAEIIRCGNTRLEVPMGENFEGELNIQNLEYRADFTVILGRDFNGRYVSEG